MNQSFTFELSCVGGKNLYISSIQQMDLQFPQLNRISNVH